MRLPPSVGMRLPPTIGMRMRKYKRACRSHNKLPNGTFGKSGQLTCRYIENSTQRDFDLWVPLEGMSTLTGQTVQMLLQDENTLITTKRDHTYKL